MYYTTQYNNQLYLIWHTLNPLSVLTILNSALIFKIMTKCLKVIHTC